MLESNVVALTLYNRETAHVNEYPQPTITLFLMQIAHKVALESFKFAPEPA